MPLGITPAELTAIRDEVAPFVEEAAARKFSALPRDRWPDAARVA